MLWTFLGVLPLLLYLLLLAGAFAVRLSSWKAGYLESRTGAALVIGAVVMMRLLRGTWSPEGGQRPPWRESLSRVRQAVIAFWS